MSLLAALNLPKPPAAAAQASAAGAALSQAKQAKLSQAAIAWRAAHQQADARISALKTAIGSHYAGSHPALLKEIDKGVGKLDGVLDNVDQSLADLLLKASQVESDGARAAELKNARTLLAQYIGYVKGEALIAHIDQNPFGVKTGLRPLLVTALTEAAKVIG